MSQSLRNLALVELMFYSIALIVLATASITLRRYWPGMAILSGYSILQIVGSSWVIKGGAVTLQPTQVIRSLEPPMLLVSVADLLFRTTKTGAESPSRQQGRWTYLVLGLVAAALAGMSGSDVFQRKNVGEVMNKAYSILILCLWFIVAATASSYYQAKTRDASVYSASIVSILALGAKFCGQCIMTFHDHDAFKTIQSSFWLYMLYYSLLGFVCTSATCSAILLIWKSSLGAQR